jgi:cell division protein FtsB
MRIRRRFSESFKMLVIPVVCCAITAYFGYAGIVGPRGLIAWNQTEAELAVKQRELAQVRAERKALEHRISLLNAQALDPDMLDEVARSMLSQGRPGEVAVPRRNHH